MISADGMAKSTSYVIALLLLTECMSVKVESVKGPDFKGKLTKLYVNLKSSKESNEFISSLALHLKKELDKHRVESIVHIDHTEALTLESDDAALLRNISSGNTYHADGVLLVEQNETTSYRSVTVGTVLTVSLYLTSNSKVPIWKGLVKVDRASALSDLEQATSIYLIKKLQFDQIIL